MTSSIPDGISFSDLESFRKDAEEKEAVKPDTEAPTYDGKTAEEVIEIAEELCNEAIERCNDPMIHKVMVMHMIENMIRWHTTAGIDQETEVSTVSWLRDAGKFQAIANILTNVSVGPDDFIMD